MPGFSYFTFRLRSKNTKMEKWAPGQNMILIFNWSGLHDPEVWSGCLALEAAQAPTNNQSDRELQHNQSAHRHPSTIQYFCK